MFLVVSPRRAGGRSRVLPERSPFRDGPQEGVKEGAHGGTMGSPVLEASFITGEVLLVDGGLGM
jgi:hypothetical protein